MIKIKLEDKIAILTLNRPEKRNSLHPILIKQFKEKLWELKENDNCRVLIITGEGGSFCAGADLKYLNELKDFSVIENEIDSETLAELFLEIYKFPKPTIAAVNGPAIAGGCGVATSCDFIVANDNSKFGYTEVKIGFIPAIVSIFLIKKIGEGIAKQLLMTGEIISGKRAFEIGLANYFADDVISESINLAKKIKSNSQISLQLTKRMIDKMSQLSVEQAVDYCVHLNSISRTSDDFKKGLNNFLNKK